MYTYIGAGGGGEIDKDLHRDSFFEVLPSLPLSRSRTLSLSLSLDKQLDHASFFDTLSSRLIFLRDSFFEALSSSYLH